MWKKIKPYIISIAIALGIGGLSSLLTRGNMDVYSTITKPPLAPPSILFPIVWTALYVLMGISCAMVYTKENASNRMSVRNALWIYGIQLLVNFFWSIIFFNLRAFGFSFIWLVLLWILIILMIKNFREICPAAAYLQLPYLLWVTFAGYLNLMIYVLNR